MAARRHPRESARLADSGGIQAHDRPGAQRGGPAAAGKRRFALRRPFAGAGPAPGNGARRHAHSAVYVLPSGAHSLVGHRPDAAGGGRPDHGRNRPRVPGSGSDHGAAHLPGQAEHPGIGGAFLFAVQPRAGRTAGCGVACTLSHLQRRLHHQRGRRVAAVRAVP